MSTLREISQAIEAQLNLIPGLRVAEFPQPSLTPPLAWPVVTGWQPVAMGRTGQVLVSIDVYVFTSATVRSIDGYRALLRYADWTGPDSIWLALWDGNDQAAGTFVGLTNTQLNVDTDQGFRALGLEEVDAFQMNGGVFSIQVVTKG